MIGEIEFRIVRGSRAQSFPCRTGRNSGILLERGVGFRAIAVTDIPFSYRFVFLHAPLVSITVLVSTPVIPAAE